MFILRIECRKQGIGIFGGEGGVEGKAGIEGEVRTALFNWYVQEG